MYKIETGDTNKILRTNCKEVLNFDTNLQDIVDEMIETMTAKDPKTDIKGVGLAANQVGIDARILLITTNIDRASKHQKIITMINPQIVSVSQNEVEMDEGCLSVPGEFFPLKRPAKVKVRWQNTKGVWSEKKFDGWDARIFLHENDHLNGILFTDLLEKNTKGKNA